MNIPETTDFEAKELRSRFVRRSDLRKVVTAAAFVMNQEYQALCAVFWPEGCAVQLGIAKRPTEEFEAAMVEIEASEDVHPGYPEASSLRNSIGGNKTDLAQGEE